MDLSFSGGGFMGCYYFGVLDCWKKHIPRNRVNRVAGASVGSLLAAFYLLDLKLDACLRQMVELIERARKRPLGVFDKSIQIVDSLPRNLDELFPDDAHKRVSDSLHVVMMRLNDRKKVIVNEFETRKDLIDALNCSCFVPIWSGSHCSTYKGVKHIDGGLKDNLPIFDEHTIRICCFSGRTDISPNDGAKKELLSATTLNMPFYFTFANFRRGLRALTPPSASFIVNHLEKGFHDTKNFILTNDLVQCDSCFSKISLCDQPIYSKISPTITPSVSPSMSRSGSYHDLNQSSPTDTSKNSIATSTRKQREKNSSGFLELGDNPRFSPSSSGIGSNSTLSESPNKKPRGFVTLRRNTIQQENQLLVLQDRFKLAPNPLPSCPPSPNLNRHCTECIRLRQEARMDLIDKDIRLEAAKYRNEQPMKEGKLKGKLMSPVNWFRQLGMKSSYKFEENIVA